MYVPVPAAIRRGKKRKKNIMENSYTQYILQSPPIYQECMYECSSTMVQTMKQSEMYISCSMNLKKKKKKKNPKKKVLTLLKNKFKKKKKKKL